MVVIGGSVPVESRAKDASQASVRMSGAGVLLWQLTGAVPSWRAAVAVDWHTFSDSFCYKLLSLLWFMVYCCVNNLCYTLLDDWYCRLAPSILLCTVMWLTVLAADATYLLTLFCVHLCAWCSSAWQAWVRSSDSHVQMQVHYPSPSPLKQRCTEHASAHINNVTLFCS